MTGKTDFTEEEWARFKRSPFAAGMAISLSDPGGPIELVKETAATLRTVTGPAAQGGRGELVTAVAEEVAAEAKARKNPLSDFRAKVRWPARRSSKSSRRSTQSSPPRRVRRTPRPSGLGSRMPRKRPLTRPRRADSSASTPSA